VRLDKWLKIARVIKRRTVANEICDQGRVVINGRTAKAATTVAVGDQLSLRFGSRLLEIEILAVPAGPIPAALASELYRVIRQTLLKTGISDGNVGEGQALASGTDDGNEAV
jgi:ribosomal 50S subunit-recycling heat shock protein